MDLGGSRMNCPVCGGKSVGRVGVEQFYCWNCYLEYQIQGENIKIFSVAEDGSLIDYAPAEIS